MAWSRENFRPHNSKNYQLSTTYAQEDVNSCPTASVSAQSCVI